MRGLIDSTLREGSQTFGVCFTLDQKKEILSSLNILGVEEIELGVSSPLNTDLPELVRFCRKKIPGKRIALWSLCRKEDILFASTLGPDVLSLSIPVSKIHIRKKLGRDYKWVLHTAKASISEARRLGFTNISLGLEDATRADQTFLETVIKTALRSGAKRIRLADTVGSASPLELALLVSTIKKKFPIEVGVHTHNDFGMATANSIAAVEAGADWADATVLGLGERAGNAHLEEVAGYLTVSGKRKYQLNELSHLSKLISTITRKVIDPHSPIIGEKIFHCETGLHIQGLTKDTSTYEPYSPELVGAERKLRFGNKIGKKEIVNTLTNMRVSLSTVDIDKIALDLRKTCKSKPLSQEELMDELTSCLGI